MEPPTLTYDDDAFYTFTVMREGKKVVYQLDSFRITIAFANEKDMAPSRREKILGPAYDGVVYYIYLLDRERNDKYFWLSKEEYDIFFPIYFKIEDEWVGCECCENRE